MYERDLQSQGKKKYHPLPIPISSLHRNFSEPSNGRSMHLYFLISGRSEYHNRVRQYFQRFYFLVPAVHYQFVSLGCLNSLGARIMLLRRWLTFYPVQS